jgi:hypothetical protein
MKFNTSIGLTLSSVAVVFFILTTSFVSKKNELSITNKTDSRIDEIHFDGSGDILDEDEVLEPGETVKVEFDCNPATKDPKAKTKKIKVKLIFVGGTIFNFEDTICDGDFVWDIVKNK